MPRQFFIALLLSFLSTTCAFGQASPLCPMNLLDMGNIGAAVEALKPLRLDSFPMPQDDKCPPKVKALMFGGRPACLLDAGLSVIAISIMFTEENGEAIGALYLSEYTPTAHASLEKFLKGRYQQLQESSYPTRFVHMPAHQHLTALFSDADALISLERPSDGMNGTWFTVLGFSRSDRLDLIRRGFNTCK